jgi:hypothetical protein
MRERAVLYLLALASLSLAGGLLLGDELGRSRLLEKKQKQLVRDIQAQFNGLRRLEQRLREEEAFNDGLMATLFRPCLAGKGFSVSGQGPGAERMAALLRAAGARVQREPGPAGMVTVRTEEGEEFAARDLSPRGRLEMVRALAGGELCPASAP